MPGEYMTVGEARKYLSVSKKKIAQLVANGTLPTVKDPLDSRSKLAKRSDVEALATRSGKKEAA